MAKKKEEAKEDEVNVEKVKVELIHPLTQEFGNGDLNTLKDKINEIIKSL